MSRGKKGNIHHFATAKLLYSDFSYGKVTYISNVYKKVYRKSWRVYLPNPNTKNFEKSAPKITFGMEIAFEYNSVYIFIYNLFETLYSLATIVPNIFLF